MDSRSEKRGVVSTLVTFSWRHEGSDVRLTGDFLHWSPGVPLTRVGDHWEVALLLPAGSVQCYKFIVDGEYVTDPEQRVATDEGGNTNNVVTVPVVTDADKLGGDGDVAARGTGIGYIGAGVVREYADEYGLKVDPGARRSGMSRSVSVSDLGGLQGRTHAAWGAAPHLRGSLRDALRRASGDSGAVDAAAAAASDRGRSLPAGGLGLVVAAHAPHPFSRASSSASMGPHGAAEGGALTPSAFAPPRAPVGTVSEATSPRAEGGAEGVDEGDGEDEGAGSPASGSGGGDGVATGHSGGESDGAVAAPHGAAQVAAAAHGGRLHHGYSASAPPPRVGEPIPSAVAAAAAVATTAAAASEASEAAAVAAAAAASVDAEATASAAHSSGRPPPHAPSRAASALRAAVAVERSASASALPRAASPATGSGGAPSVSSSPRFGRSSSGSGLAIAPHGVAGAAGGGPAAIGPSASASALLPSSPAVAAVGLPVSIPINPQRMHLPTQGSAVAAGGMGGGGGAGGASGLGLVGGAGAATPNSAARVGVGVHHLKRDGKLVVALVGLPARGKTFMARLLQRHLVWQGYRTILVNVGDFRRRHLGAQQPAAFFDPNNPEGETARRAMAKLAFDDMTAQLASNTVDVAIFDATNSTRDRRAWLREALAAHGAATGVKSQLVFVESVCTDEAVIRSNILLTKLRSPDYKAMDPEKAVEDFVRRIDMYAKAYETITDEAEGDVPWIKLVDVGRQLVANRVSGYLCSRIVFFLAGISITPRPIWLTRHGESEYNVQGLIGGDSALSPRGQAYALRLASFMEAVYPGGAASDLTVWTSSLRRTQLTAAPLGREIVVHRALDEIDAGLFDGLTYAEIAERAPEEYAARSRSKFTYRYPRGESYQDIVHRLEPVIVELMRTKEPILIVSHQATLRCLYSYLTNQAPEACPDALIPLHTVIQLTPNAYGCDETRHELL